MARKAFNGASWVLLVLIVVPAIPATAQINPSGTTAFQDSRGGAVGTRAPGRLVADGLGRHSQFTNFQFGITEVQTPSPRSLALVTVFETLFADLNAAIQSFTALLLARAGQNPLS
jgi:hypothetical protein